MRHIHARTVQTKSGYRAIIEVYDHGAKLATLEGKDLKGTLAKAENYAKKVGAEFLVESEGAVHS